MPPAVIPPASNIRPLAASAAPVVKPEGPPVARKPGETAEAWQIRTAAFQTRYAYSRAALDRGDFAAAAGGFEAILREEPGFLDVPQLLVKARAGLKPQHRLVGAVDIDHATVDANQRHADRGALHDLAQECAALVEAEYVGVGAFGDFGRHGSHPDKLPWPILMTGLPGPAALSQHAKLASDDEREANIVGETLPKSREGMPLWRQKATKGRESSSGLSGGWRRGWDSNPREAFDLYSLSRGAPSTTRPPLHGARITRQTMIFKQFPWAKTAAASGRLQHPSSEAMRRI